MTDDLHPCFGGNSTYLSMLHHIVIFSPREKVVFSPLAKFIQSKLLKYPKFTICNHIHLIGHIMKTSGKAFYL